MQIGINNRASSLLITCLLFLSICFDCCSQLVPVRRNAFTYSYGCSYRFDNIYTHVFSIDKWRMTHGCVSCRYRSFGISGEFTDNRNYNLGLKFSTNFPGHSLCPVAILYLGLEPTLFSLNNSKGVNAAPEIGLHFTRLNKYLGLSLNMLYGYDITLINKTEYNMSRHRLTFKIGLDHEKSRDYTLIKGRK